MDPLSTLVHSEPTVWSDNPARSYDQDTPFDVQSIGCIIFPD
jgi:hypothetical protein